MENNSNLPWSYKYRPRKISDLIMTDKNEKKLRDYVNKGAINNIILAGIQGTGKSTYAKLVLDLFVKDDNDYEKIDASLDNGIDVVRDVVRYAESTSYSGELKIVYFEESDGLSKAAQKGLRTIIEDSASNARFVFTCNYITSMMDAIQSRCTVIDLAVPNTQKYIFKVLKRLLYILEAENITNVDFVGINKYLNGKGGLTAKNKGVVLDLMGLIRDNLPDIRSIVEKLDENCVGGVLGKIKNNTSDTYINNIVSILGSDSDRHLKSTKIQKILKTENVNYTIPLITALFNNAETLSPKDYSQIHILCQQMQNEDVNAINKVIHIMGYIQHILNVLHK